MLRSSRGALQLWLQGPWQNCLGFPSLTGITSVWHYLQLLVAVDRCYLCRCCANTSEAFHGNSLARIVF